MKKSLNIVIATVTNSQRLNRAGYIVQDELGRTLVSNINHQYRLENLYLDEVTRLSRAGKGYRVSTYAEPLRNGELASIKKRVSGVYGMLQSVSVEDAIKKVYGVIPRGAKEQYLVTDGNGRYFLLSLEQLITSGYDPVVTIGSKPRLVKEMAEWPRVSGVDWKLVVWDKRYLDRLIFKAVKESFIDIGKTDAKVAEYVTIVK